MSPARAGPGRPWVLVVLTGLLVVGAIALGAVFAQAELLCGIVVLVRHLQHGVAVQSQLDFLLEIHGRQLQQPNSLLQLRCHRQLLAQFKLQRLFHGVGRIPGGLLPPAQGKWDRTQGQFSPRPRGEATAWRGICLYFMGGLRAACRKCERVPGNPAALAQKRGSYIRKWSPR